MRRMSGDRAERAWRVVRRERSGTVDEWVERFVAEGGIYDERFWQRAARKAMKDEARHLLTGLQDETGVRAVVNVQRTEGRRKVRVYKIREDMTPQDHRQVQAMHKGKQRAHCRLANVERRLALTASHGAVQLSLFEVLEIRPDGSERRTRGD
jgi:hypothetical protein